VVSVTVANPSVPEDEEVILVSIDGGSLPLGIIVAEEQIDISQWAEFNAKPTYPNS
jgi:hypothetical protein